MNRVIKGKRYNTESAEILCSADSGQQSDAESMWHITFYRKTTGEIFMRTCGG
jgi:hypothetical protein